jgi:hypothetical protein
MNAETVASSLGKDAEQVLLQPGQGALALDGWVLEEMSYSVRDVCPNLFRRRLVEQILLGERWVRAEVAIFSEPLEVGVLLTGEELELVVGLVEQAILDLLQAGDGRLLPPRVLVDGRVQLRGKRLGLLVALCGQLADLGV